MLDREQPRILSPSRMVMLWVRRVPGAVKRVSWGRRGVGVGRVGGELVEVPDTRMYISAATCKGRYIINFTFGIT